MIAITLSNKNLDSVVTVLFIRGRKVNISLVFITQTELQQIAFSYSSEINFKDFMNLYKKITAKPHSFFRY